MDTVEIRRNICTKYYYICNKMDTVDSVIKISIYKSCKWVNNKFSVSSLQGSHVRFVLTWAISLSRKRESCRFFGTCGRLYCCRKTRPAESALTELAIVLPAETGLEVKPARSKAVVIESCLQTEEQFLLSDQSVPQAAQEGKGSVMWKQVYQIRLTSTLTERLICWDYKLSNS